MTDADGSTRALPPIWLSLLPIVILIALMVLNVIKFGDNSSYGPNQLALLVGGAVAGLLGVWRLGLEYAQLQKGIVQSIGMAIEACLILLVIGALIGAWIQAGIVPTIIYYGYALISPAVFLPLACIACAMISLATGSSWTTTGTIGVALIAIGHTYKIPPGMVAGAIISGAYFGDKMSPLSDTTNLAPAMVGVNLFDHIKHMVFTSLPALVLAILGFVILSLIYRSEGASPKDIEAISQLLKSQFHLGPHLLVVPVLVLLMVAKKIPALPALSLGAVAGSVLAMLVQKVPQGADIYGQAVDVLANGYKMQSGHDMLDKLLSRGGMAPMLNTVWLILCAMVFGGIMEATGMLESLARGILRFVKNTGSLIGATIASCLLVNTTAGDQFVAIVVPARMFRSAYERFGLHPKNLSRAVEDGGTVTSVLVPWNSGGIYNSGVLGVATLTYLPYCFFNILSPLVSIFLGAMGWTIAKHYEAEDAAA